MWEPQVEALSEGYRVITYDVRGDGGTGPSAEPRYTDDLFAADFRALVEALSLSRPEVCELSLGGRSPRATSPAPRSSSPGGPSRPGSRSAIDSSTSCSRAEMALSVRLLGPKRYANWAFWLARRLRGAG